MKKVIAALLLSVFFLQVFYTAGITIWFYANRTYIANQLCINKNKPGLGCKGSCFLKKKLREAEQQQDEQLPVQERQIKETVPCILSTVSYAILSPVAMRVYIPATSGVYSFIYLKDIFHPPSAIVS